MLVFYCAYAIALMLFIALMFSIALMLVYCAYACPPARSGSDSSRGVVGVWCRPARTSAGADESSDFWDTRSGEGKSGGMPNQSFWLPAEPLALSAYRLCSTPVYHRFFPFPLCLSLRLSAFRLCLSSPSPVGIPLMPSPCLLPIPLMLFARKNRVIPLVPFFPLVLFIPLMLNHSSYAKKDEIRLSIAQSQNPSENKNEWNSGMGKAKAE